MLNIQKTQQKQDSIFGAVFEDSCHKLNNIGVQSIREVLQNIEEEKFISHHQKKREIMEEKGDDEHNFEIDNGKVKIVNYDIDQGIDDDNTDATDKAT